MYRFRPIGLIHSCFKEKFGIPRQSGLIPAAEATLELIPPFDRDEAVRGLKGFSHLWVLFLFPAQAAATWRPTVRPPRLGGNRRIGVFASRSPFRPNPIGLSAVRLTKIERVRGRLVLQLRGVDFLDGTPVLDIKPYIPYADSIPDASGGFASSAPGVPISVHYASAAAAFLATLDAAEAGRLQTLLEGILAQDPRPAYLGGTRKRRIFGMHVLEYQIRWRWEGAGVTVITIAPEA